MKKSASCFKWLVLPLIAILFIIVWHQLMPNDNINKHLLLRCPNPIILQKVDSLNYLFYRSSPYPFKIAYHFELLDPAIVEINSSEHLYKYKHQEGLKLVASDRVRLDFEEDAQDMWRKMSIYTDDLSNHDNLYMATIHRLYIPKIFYKDPVIKTYPLKDRLRYHLDLPRVIFNNFNEIRVIRHSELVDDISFVMRKEPFYSLYFTVLFHDNLTNNYYLLEELPIEETTWGLYYYPTCLIDTTGFPFERYTKSYASELGTLYETKKTLIPNDGHTRPETFEFYTALDTNNHYFKSVSYKIDYSYAQEKCKDLRKDYYDVTRRLNTVIDEYRRCNNN